MNDEQNKPLPRKVHALVRCPYCYGFGWEQLPQGNALCVECGGSGKLKLLEHDLKHLKKLEEE